MSRNQKIFLTILGIYVIFDFVLGSLVGVFLWDQTGETKVLLVYYLALFTSIMFFSQIASYLMGRFGSKKVYIFSIVLGMLQALLLLVYQASISQMIVFFGLLAGASIGLQAVSYGLVASAVTYGEDASSFLGIKSSLMNIISIISVPLITFIIAKNGSYNISYFIGLLAGVIVIILISLLKIEDSKSSYHPLSFISSALSTPDSRTYLLTRFVYGLFSGPSWAIFGIIIFKFAGNLSTWGIISTIFTIIHIIGSYLYGKISSHNIHKAYSTFSTLIFAIVVILLATNWNFATFLIYQFGLVLLNIAFSIHYENLTYAILSENELFIANKKELLGLGEICIGIGRLVPMAILLIVGFTLEDNLMIQVLLVAVASLPLLITALLKSTAPFHNHYVNI